MYQKSNVYTPQISRQTGFVLMRIAWGLGTPMTKALNHAILALVPKLNHVVFVQLAKTKGVLFVRWLLMGQGLSR